MGSWLATTSMGDSPVINVEIWTDGTVRNGTSVTAYAALCLKAIQGQSWWGLGVNVSWGWYDGSGRWVQGQDIVMKSILARCLKQSNRFRPMCPLPA